MTKHKLLLGVICLHIKHASMLEMCSTLIFSSFQVIVTSSFQVIVIYWMHIKHKFVLGICIPIAYFKC